MSDVPEVSENQKTDDELAEEIRLKAAAIAESGVSSYSHGQRQVNRSDPEKMLNVSDRLALRHARRRRGFVAECDQSAGAL